MANPEHLKILRRGVDAWNEWRKKNPGVWLNLVEVNLRRANLFGVNLNEADLSEANLNSADLSFASLRAANLRDANLRRANLFGANLCRANLFGADLNTANLREADLREANLIWTNLHGADFRKADLSKTGLGETIFNDTNLNAAKGLEQCNYHGPSGIDYHTLAKSVPLPLAFLRGCGLPDTLIDYLPSLLQEPIQFYSCFISYSSKDQEFAERLHADLQEKGVRCWFAPDDIRAGQKIYLQIDEAIRFYDKLLLVLSEYSMHSNWVATEIKRTRQRELSEGRQMLFPVSICPFEEIRAWELFDTDEGRDLAAEVREYFIPDFSNWKDHDAYQAAFDRLLRDLKAEI